MKLINTILAILISLNSMAQIQPGLYLKMGSKFSSFGTESASLSIKSDKTFNYLIKNVDCFNNSSFSIKGVWEMYGNTLILSDSTERKKPAGETSSYLLTYTSVRRTFYKLNFITNTLSFIKVAIDDSPPTFINTWGNFKL
jgi:hypothetical protein